MIDGEDVAMAMTMDGVAFLKIPERAPPPAKRSISWSATWKPPRSIPGSRADT